MNAHQLNYKHAASLALDAQGRQSINVLAKRTYDIVDGSRVRLSDCQLDFVDEDEMKPKETEPGWYPEAEIDLVPFKIFTDIVVTGNVVAPDEKPVTSMQAEVIIGNTKKSVRVFGNRLIEMTANGKLSFTPPEPFISMSMNYCLAYGGVDPSVPRNEDPKTVLEWSEYLTLERHAGVYPRNPVGQAYVVNRERWLLNGRPLPNFEDPQDLLNPERIVVGRPEDWWRQPMPAGFGWFGRSWYPRSIHCGVLPPFPPSETKSKEALSGLLPPDHVSKIKAGTFENYPKLFFFNGASPGLAVRRIRGNEMIKISGMSPGGDTLFQLPGEWPEISISFEGKPLEIKDRHIHTVWIKKEKNIFTMVWSACANTPKMLPLTLPTRENPMCDDLEGAEIRINGIHIPHEPVNVSKSE